MNKLILGTAPLDLPRGGSLFITDTIRSIPDWRHPRLFDPLLHSFNPLANLDYRKACDIVDIFDALFDKAGATTLTKEAGLEYIADLLEKQPADFSALSELIPEPDKKSTPGHVWAYTKVRRILRSPVLSKVFGRPNFTFKRGSVNQCRINRAELGSFDATALVLFLIANFKGQIIVENYRPYAKPFHISLLEEGRLIVKVRRLKDLRDLQDDFITEEKEYSGVTHEDAVEIAKYDCKQPPGTDGYDTSIKRAMAIHTDR